MRKRFSVPTVTGARLLLAARAYADQCNPGERAITGFSSQTLTMARLHADNRYDRLTHDIETITGRPATSVRDFVGRQAKLRRATKKLTDNPDQ